MNGIALTACLGLAFLGVSHRMDSSIGGKSVTRYHPSVYDAKQKLYLYSSGDCDGAHKRLTLTGDLRSIAINEGAVYEGLSSADVAEALQRIKTECKPGPIKAKTNLGIRLGMSPAEVQRILGKPTKSMWSKKFSAKELIYSTETDKDAEGFSDTHSNYYLFRGGKLYYIELDEDLGGAC
jgi:hypothetical protein